MADPKELTNLKTVTVEINGQQESMLRKLVAKDPQDRSLEDIIRDGFSEFAKEKRLSR